MIPRNSHKKAQKGAKREVAETRTVEPPRRKDRKGDAKKVLQLKLLALFASWRFAILGNLHEPEISAISDQGHP
jgi:hypothetical protein